MLSAERSDWVTVWGCGGSWRVDIRYILEGVGGVIDWRLNSFTAGNWSPPFTHLEHAMSVTISRDKLTPAGKNKIQTKQTKTSKNQC